MLPDVAGVPPPRTPGRGPPGLEEDPLRRATRPLFRDRGHRSGFPRSCSTHSEWVTRLPSAALGNDRGLTAESPPRPTPGRVHRARGLFAAFRHFEGRNGHALPACAFTADRGALRVAAPFRRWLPGHLPARAELSRRGAISPTTAVPQPDRRWASSRHGERRNGPADMSRGTGAVCD